MTPHTRGFTLIEITVALLVAGLILVAAMPMLEPSLRQRSQLETKERLERVARAILTAYEREAMSVDAEADDVFRLGDGHAIVNGSDAANPTTAAALTSIATIAGSSLADIAEDTGHNRLRFYVSQRQALSQPGGYQLYWRNVAIVSSGWNARFDAGTGFDKTTGVLAVGGDDLFVMADGYALQKRLSEESVQRVRRLARTYESYFQSRYLMHATRDLAINYFATGSVPTGRWDTGNPVAQSAGTGSPAAYIGLPGALGLGPNDVRDAYGADLLIDNQSSATRSPLNPDPLLALPPYTAIVRARLPGGQFYAETAFGAF
jgi:prepilin-type N-terminal cleavage/methylation domain-containing protein